MLNLVYTSSLLFLYSAGCTKLYVRAHTDQFRSAAAVVTCAESNFWDARGCRGNWELALADQKLRKKGGLDDVDGQHAVCLLRLDWVHKEVVQSALFGPPNPRPTMTPPHHGGVMLLPKD
eukprot:1146013-Pelagomonas_calceolata.AAC.2